MLSERQCETIEQGLTTDVEPRKAAAYLCLHMGLMLSEAAALRVSDLDLDGGTVNIRAIAVKTKEAGVAVIPADMPRTLPMPRLVQKYLRENEWMYQDGDCYVMSGGKEPPPFHLMQNVLNSINKKHAVAETLSAMDLRNAFIRRCIEAGMDLYSLCAYIGIKQPNVITKRFGDYFRAHYEKLEELQGASGEERTDGRDNAGINLLILGAGSQGPVVKEIAEALGIFSRIAFLDDDANNRLAIGPLADYKRLRHRFQAAIPSFGNPQLRREYFDKLTDAGYAIPRLIHPSATISGSNVKLGEGVVIEAKVIIANGVTVGDNTILSAGCVLDKECIVEEDAHADCACTVPRGSHVPRGTRIPAGTVYGK